MGDRTEMEVAADTIMALIAARVISTVNQKDVALAVSHVTEGELRRAQRRWAKSEAVPFPRMSLVPVPETLPTEPQLRKDGKPKVRAKTRRRRFRHGREELWCTLGQHYAPKEAFRVSKDRSKPSGVKVKSFCMDHERKYQEGRYLSVKKAEALAEIGIEFVVEDGDSELRCVDCGRTLELGDKVAGRLDNVHHLECPRDKGEEEDGDDG